MKTAEEIANEEIPYDGGLWSARPALTWGEVQEIVVSAIETDRDQFTEYREDLLEEALTLLSEVQSLGLTFFIGNAYISRAYIEQQEKLRSKIRDLERRSVEVRS